MRLFFRYLVIFQIEISSLARKLASENPAKSVKPKSKFLDMATPSKGRRFRPMCRDFTRDTYGRNTMVKTKSGLQVLSLDKMVRKYRSDVTAGSLVQIQHEEPKGKSASQWFADFLYACVSILLAFYPLFYPLELPTSLINNSKRFAFV